MRLRKLTDAERETVIQFDCASDIATIWCADSEGIKSLKKIKGVTIIEETQFGTRFEINKNEIKIGTPKRVSRTAKERPVK